MHLNLLYSFFILLCVSCCCLKYSSAFFLFPSINKNNNFSKHHLTWNNKQAFRTSSIPWIGVAGRKEHLHVHEEGKEQEKIASNLPIFQEINNLVVISMKAKEKQKLLALRNIKAAFTTKMKESNADELSDEDALVILKKLQKMRKESIELFQKSTGREDMIAQEELELKLIEHYLPQLADEATTKKWVKEAIEATGATSKKEFGKVMGMIMKNHKNEVDGDMVKKITTELLD